MQGWVSFHRQIMKWEWYTDPNTFRLFFHLVLNANHEKGRWKGNDIERGQFITSSDKLASQLDLSRQQIRTAINKLKSTNEITTKPTNKFTLVTVVNYDFYQDDARKVTNKITTKATNEQPTDNQQVTTNNNDNNKKNENTTTVAEFYNTLQLPKYQKLTDKRKSSINARVKEYGVDTVKEVLQKASESNFLKNERASNWYNFDWLFNPNNFVKILENKYDSKKEDEVIVGRVGMKRIGL
jgi:hypothetical protein